MPLPKTIGRDCELSTTGLTPEGRTVPSWEVARHVLAHIGAAFEPIGGRVWSPPRLGWAAESDSTDAWRHWASSGQSYYADMGHVEAASAETSDPRTLAAQSLSTLRACEAARRRAEAEAAPGTRYALTTANVDILEPDISWGTHFNVAVEPELWEDLCRAMSNPRRRFVASAIAALIPFFGAGYVMPFRSGARFSLSGRAHHLRKLSTLSTTVAYGRGLLNDRREAHSAVEDRLHLIGFDWALAGNALLASTLQCVLAVAELGLAIEGLDDPVRAATVWSYGLDAATGRPTGIARTETGGAATLPRFMRRLVGFLIGRVTDGSIPEEIAPGASELLPVVLDLARYLEEGSIPSAARHLDWAAKLMVLCDMCEREHLPLHDARVRVADHDYASTDPTRGHFWRLWEEGRVDPLVTPERVEHCLVDGPEDGRAWARGRLIREYFDQVTDVDWSFVALRGEKAGWPYSVRVAMPGTRSLSRNAFEPALTAARRGGDLRILEWMAGGHAAYTEPRVNR